MKEIKSNSPHSCDLYILKGRVVTPETNILKWSVFMSKHRFLKKTYFDDLNVEVSTIFLGINHGSSEQRLLFKTLIFGSEHARAMRRCAIWEEAMQMHKVACELVNQKRLP